jgi:hypothetical protein
MRLASSFSRERMMKLKSAIVPLLALAFLNAGMAWCAPAAWYKWRSKSDGTLICMQTPPGSGWTKADGPYKDAQCIIAGKPGS